MSSSIAVQLKCDWYRIASSVGTARNSLTIRLCFENGEFSLKVIEINFLISARIDFEQECNKWELHRFCYGDNVKREKLSDEASLA